MVDVHVIGQSLFHGVQDISVNVIELWGFVLPQVRLVIVEGLCLKCPASPPPPYQGPTWLKCRC